jgi:hypothetical protein
MQWQVRLSQLKLERCDSMLGVNAMARLPFKLHNLRQTTSEKPNLCCIFANVDCAADFSLVLPITSMDAGGFDQREVSSAKANFVLQTLQICCVN